MDGIGQRCMARSLGPANNLVTALISTLVTMHCNISTPDMWPPDFSPIAVKDGLPKYDYIVIGSGTAGSVVAGRLAEIPENKILLIEAGGDPPMESEIPGLQPTTLYTKYDWQYETTTNSLSCLAMEDESCIWHKGKMLGGSSGISSMTYIKGNSRDYDSWEDAGNPTWGWRDVLPFFKKSQNYRGPDRYGAYGEGGPLNIEPFASSKSDQYMILEASAELGYRQVADFSEGQYLGFGFVYGTLEDGRRESTAKAYLGAGKPNIDVLKNAYAYKINFDDARKADSVSIVINGSLFVDAHATKEIIVSAGAIETPKLLMLSGIGPKTHLTAMGIPVVRDLPVGDNLQDHVSVVLFLKYDSPYYTGKDTQTLDSIYNQWVHQSGAYGNAALDIAGFVSTKQSSRFPDVEYQFAPVTNLSQASLGLKRDILNSFMKQVSPKDQVLKVSVTVLKPKSRGHVRLDTKDYKYPPLIIPNSFQKDIDIKTMVKGIRELFDLEKTKAFERVHGRFMKIELPACSSYRYKSAAYWECYIKYMTSSMYHAAGTAKMGPDTDHNAVVDPELKVRGIKKLRVVDASIVPDLVSGDLNAPVIMIAEKGAEFIKETYKTV